MIMEMEEIRIKELQLDTIKINNLKESIEYFKKINNVTEIYPVPLPYPYRFSARVFFEFFTGI